MTYLRKTLAAVTAVTLLGCSGAPADDPSTEAPAATVGADSPDDEGGSTEAMPDVGGVTVDRGLLDVEVTVPASFFEGQDVGQVVAAARAEGREVEANADGSVTYRMTRSEHSEFMSELRTTLLDGFDDLPTDFPSIQGATANGDFSKITLTVDRDAFENGFDSFAMVGVAFGAGFYQLFDGTASDDIRVEVLVQDAATQQVYRTYVFPDDVPE